MKLFCATTCDPDAASFMDVYELFWNPSTNAIEQVEVYMTYDFADILYDACKNVQSSQQGEEWRGPAPHTLWNVGGLLFGRIA